MENATKREFYELRIAQLESEISLLRMQLTNAEKRVLDEQMMRELDRLAAN